MDRDELIYDYISETINANEAVNRFASGIADSISNILGIGSEPAGIKLERTDEGLRVDLKLIVNYGFNIPQLSFDIQSQLKSGIEKITDENIESINIIVEGVKANE